MVEYHHYSVTTEKQFKADRYQERMGWWVRDYRNSPYRIALVRPIPDSACPEVLNKNPHICFVVDSVDEEIKGKEVIVPPFYIDNRKVAFTRIDGINVEFYDFQKQIEYEKKMGISDEREKIAIEYHHYSVPTDQPFEADRYSEDMGWWVRDFVNNPYRIALIRIAPDSSCPEILQRNPHICFKVPDVEEAIKGREVILPPFYTRSNIKVAYILVDGVNVEFVEASEDLKY